MPRLTDETGNTYGRLWVIGRAPNRGGRVYWWCRCKCGVVIPTMAKTLRNGGTKSCGCLKNGCQIKSELGNVYGVLRVKKFAGIKGRRAMWLCKCGGCKGTHIISGHDLRALYSDRKVCPRHRKKNSEVARMHQSLGQRQRFNTWSLEERAKWVALRRGEKNGRAKLTPEWVSVIRHYLREEKGFTFKQIARIVTKAGIPVHLSTVALICYEKNWVRPLAVDIERLEGVHLLVNSHLENAYG